MRKRMTVLSTLVGLLCCLGSAQIHAAEIWSGDTLIRQLYPASTGMFFITAYKNTSLSTCDGGGRWYISSSSPNYQVMIASLLTAFAAGKQVSLNITVNPPECAGVVNRFVVKDY